MSVSESKRREAQRCQEQITRFQQQKADLAKKAAESSRRANDARQLVSKASTPSSASSRLRDVERYEKERASVEKQIAEKERQIGQEQKKLGDAQQRLAREETKEQQDRERKSHRESQEHNNRMRQLTSTISQHDRLHKETLSRVQQLENLPKQIVILFLASNPVDQPELRLDEEVRSITERIRMAKHRDAIRLESRWAVRPADVLQAINELNPTIVHFSGHGASTDEIILQTNNGLAKPVSLEAVSQMIAATSDSIRLVFFNTCYSRNQAEATATHVEAAVGMNTAVDDDAARIFAAQFYSAIGFGHSVKKAFDQSIAILMMEGTSEENTPELFVQPGLDPSEIILVNPDDGES